jgi:quinohemoprotein ethanol dehydrogenase
MSARYWSFLCATILAGCGVPPTPGQVTLDRWRNADAEPHQWLGLGRTYHADRFSPLTRLTADNAGGLGFAWEADARSHRGRVEHGQEATPIVVDGVLYVSGPWGTAFAVDARTGSQIWRYDPVRLARAVRSVRGAV